MPPRCCASTDAGHTQLNSAWLNRFRRLTVRHERRADIHQEFLSLGCALIGWNYLRAE